MVDRYVEKVYAGFLGKNAGIRLGAPVEPAEWTFEKIREIYGEISGYLKPYKNFAADDDVNGPVYFLRAMNDKDPDKELTCEDVANAWLNYTRSGIGMFWWGGDGVSTEHTAFLNLKNNIPAPRSGSIEQNGLTAAEQIGGQIFIDTWGLIWPSNPQKAAEYAMKAAAVSHDGNGLYGAAFIAACIARAFATTSIQEIIEAGLSVIPRNCEYRRVVESVCLFHLEHPERFEPCMEYLIREWGYDRYPGICHIIPNAGVCVLALLYGNGDFGRTIEIASMCGWDTDCNAGNVGTILGVANGPEGLPKRYREPINDFIVLSGVSGYLNILDAPTYARDVAQIGYRLTGETMPEEIRPYAPGQLHFDFELPGSTHGFRLSDQIRFMKRHSTARAYRGTGSLEIVIDRILPEDSCRVYYKPFYRRRDFDNERYKPVFSPQVYSGQKVSFMVYVELWNQGQITLIPYIHSSMRDEELRMEPVRLVQNNWIPVSFIVPESLGDPADEVGFILEAPPETTSRVFGHLFLDEFVADGPADYHIDMRLQKAEFSQITPFSMHQGHWGLTDGYLCCRSDTEAMAFTGNYYTSDADYEADIQPIDGFIHGITIRMQGTERGYLFAFDGKNRVSLTRLRYGKEILAAASYPWETKSWYHFQATADGNHLQLTINGEPVLEATDDCFTYGMLGLYLGERSECHFQTLHIHTF